MDLHLPPGYHTSLDPDVLVLRRADGSQAAIFCHRGFVGEAVEQAAWEDYGEPCASSHPEIVHPLGMERRRMSPVAFNQIPRIADHVRRRAHEHN